MDIVSACGKALELDSLHISWTYAGLIEGRPNPRLNAFVVERARPFAEQLYGPRPTHLLPPPDGDRLPARTYFAWLMASVTLYGDGFGSELVLIWFGADEPKRSINEIVAETAAQIDWASHARDCGIP